MMTTPSSVESPLPGGCHATGKIYSDWIILGAGLQAEIEVKDEDS